MASSVLKPINQPIIAPTTPNSIANRLIPNGVLSIEHEDSFLSGREGFLKAVAFLKEVILSEPKSAVWWA